MAHCAVHGFECGECQKSEHKMKIILSTSDSLGANCSVTREKSQLLLQLRDNTTSQNCSHRSRNWFSGHKTDSSKKKTTPLSDQRSRKVSQRLFHTNCSVRTNRSTPLSSSP